MISNIFAPLFLVTIDPKSDPDLYYFLLRLVGIDSVDDESALEDVYYIYLTIYKLNIFVTLQ